MTASAIRRRLGERLLYILPAYGYAGDKITVAELGRSNLSRGCHSLFWL